MCERWTSILALAAALVVAGAGIATAYTPTIIKESFLLPVELNGGFKPTRLPKKKLAPVHLKVEGTINALEEAHLPALQELVLEIDRNVRIDARGLAVCKPVPLEAARVAVPYPCKGTRVGEGGMEFEIALPESAPFDVNAQAVAFNGGKRDGVTTVLVHAYLSNPVAAAVVIRVKITKVHHGRYGTKMVATIPTIAGGYGSVKKLQLEFFRAFVYKGKKRSFMRAKCTDGKLQVGWKAALADGTVSDGSFKRPCTPQSEPGFKPRTSTPRPRQGYAPPPPHGARHGAASAG